MIIAQAFNLAFERWKEKNKEENSTSEKCQVCKCGFRLAVGSDTSEDTLAYNDTLKQREEPSSNYVIRENRETCQIPVCKFVTNLYILSY